MITSEFDNTKKITARQRAKQLVADRMQAAYYFDDELMSEAEREEVIQHIDAITVRLERGVFVIKGKHYTEV